MAVEVPYSIANVGPGFDRLGLCLDGRREWAAFAPGGRGLRIEVIGDSRIPRTPHRNVAALAFRWTARRLGAPTPDGRLTLVKRVRAGSGLGSSGASALAGALLGARWAGAPVSDPQVLVAILRGAAQGERGAAGTAHFDNVAASLFGGLVLIESDAPLRVHRIEPGSGFRIVVVTPVGRLATRVARRAIPDRIPRRDAIANLGFLGALLLGFVGRDLRTVGRALTDRIAEPYRAPLVPGCLEAIAAARAEGAWGAALAGSGPSVFALAPARYAPSVARAMAERFDRIRPGTRAWITGAGAGARIAPARDGPARTESPNRGVGSGGEEGVGRRWISRPASSKGLTSPVGRAVASAASPPPASTGGRRRSSAGRSPRSR